MSTHNDVSSSFAWVGTGVAESRGPSQCQQQQHREYEEKWPRHTIYDDTNSPAGLEVVSPPPAGLEVADQHFQLGIPPWKKASFIDVPSNGSEFQGLRPSGRQDSDDRHLPGRHRKHVLWILCVVIAAFLTTGGVVGGVLGSQATARNAKQQSSPESTSTPTRTGTSEPTGGPAPTAVVKSIRPNSRLAAAGWRTLQGVQVWVHYQGPDNKTRSSFFNGMAWEGPDEIPFTSSAAADSALALCVIVAGDYYNPQREHFFHDRSGKLVGVSLRKDEMVQDSVSQQSYVGAPAAGLATYWPHILLLDPSDHLNHVQNRPTGDKLLPTIGWDIRSLPPQASALSRFAVVPLHANFSAVSGRGGFGVFFQDPQGKLAAYWPESDLIPPARQSWPQTNNAVSFDGPSLPLGAAFAAFAAAKADELRGLNRVNTYVLYQDPAESAGGRIYLKFLQAGDSEWKTSSPPGLASADMGTDIACLTMPESLQHARTADVLLLEPASPATARCYFQRGGKLVEVTFDGLTVSSPSEVPIP